MMDTVSRLRAARELLKKGWCQNVSALTGDGVVVAVDDPGACRFCATGALDHFWRGSTASLFAGHQAAIRHLNKVVQERGFGSIISYNDSNGRTQAQMIAIFDEAIAEAEAGVVVGDMYD
jgi:hypothetical protein